MSEIIDVILPVFLLVSIGFVAARSGYLGVAAMDGVSAFCFKLGMPAVIFRSVATADFHGVNPWGLWAAYFSAMAIAWVLGNQLSQRVFGRSAAEAVVAGFSACFSNVLLVGLPLIQRSVGDAGLLPFALLVSVHLPTMMTVTAIMMEHAHAQRGEATKTSAEIAGSILKALSESSIVLGVLLGGLVRISGIPIEGAVKSIVDDLAIAAGPTALVAMGGALVKYGVKGEVLPSAVISLTKLLLQPALVYATVHLFGLPPVWRATLVLCAACPTGVNAYIVAHQFGAAHGLSSSVITMTTGLAALTMSFWLVLVLADMQSAVWF